jgi:tetratricopeptide (TPR) repeat protein
MIKKIAILFVALLLGTSSLYAAAAQETTNKGVEYVKSGKYDEAIAEFTKDVALDPQDADAYNNRGIAYLARLSSERVGQKDLKKIVADFDSANADFNKAIKLKPDFAAAYYNRGLTNIAQYEKAIVDFSRTIALKPDNARAYYYRAVEYFNIKEYSQSWADVRKAQKMGYEVDPNFLKKLESKAAGVTKK